MCIFFKSIGMLLPHTLLPLYSFVVRVEHNNYRGNHKDAFKEAFEGLIQSPVPPVRPFCLEVCGFALVKSVRFYFFHLLTYCDVQGQVTEDKILVTNSKLLFANPKTILHVKDFILGPSKYWISYSNDPSFSQSSAA